MFRACGGGRIFVEFLIIVTSNVDLMRNIEAGVVKFSENRPSKMIKLIFPKLIMVSHVKSAHYIC